MDIKQTDMPPAEAARRTKEFRCPPREQVNFSPLTRFYELSTFLLAMTSYLDVSSAKMQSC